jgi:NAD-dependent DNA ligase
VLKWAKENLMESFIGIMGGLVTVLLVGVSIAFVVIVVFKWGKRAQQPGFKGAKNCLICGSPMEAVAGSYIVRCTNPKCPNNSVS